MKKIKTIDITAKEWFERINGNSYFSARVTTNYGMKDEKTYVLPFQYGYGSQYEYEALQTLQKNNVISKDITAISQVKKAGIILRSHKIDNQTKKTVKQWGE